MLKVSGVEVCGRFSVEAEVVDAILDDFLAKAFALSAVVAISSRLLFVATAADLVEGVEVVDTSLRPRR